MGKHDAPIATVAIEPAWNKSQWDYVQQLKAQVLHLENKLNSILKERNLKQTLTKKYNDYK